MKKIYMILASLGILSSASAQQAFWDVVNYKGAFPVTDGTSATDWTSGWSNFNPENTPYGATTTTASTNITTNTTWSGIVLLQNKIYVKNNATLTILPGTIIRGDFATQGTLIITRGAKINAVGTATQPIVFTSNNDVGLRGEGDWGGLVILGLAKNNQPGGVANIEGILQITDTQFGGSYDNDDSGSLKYVRVEFAGIALEANKEINGITFGSVGSATDVDYIQVSHSGDDAFEWFGGTVDCKHLIAYRTLDDDFDTDFGYRGKVQFGLIIRDNNLYDGIGDSNAFESDNDNAGSAAQPKTMPIFSNITIVGPKGNGSLVLPGGETFEKAFRLRRNTSTSVFNSLVTGWQKGLSIEGAPVEANVNGDSLVFSHNVLSTFTTATNCVTGTPTFYSTFFGADGNDTTMTIPQIDWVNIFTPLGSTPDARLNGSSSAASGADFSHIKFYNLTAPTASATITYCQGETASALAATPGAGNSLYWYTQANGGVASTSAPVPSTAAAATYYYWVSQYNVAGDESPRRMITVQVNPTPATPTISASGSTSFCTGGSVVLTSNQTSGNEWSNSSVANSITVNASGAFTVTYTDINGCSATSTATIVDVSSAPVPTINPSATQACTGETVTLTSSVADTYNWSTGAITQSITLTSTATAVTVTTTNANACSGVGTSAPITVTFTQTPTAAGSFTTAGNVVTFTNTSTNATDYSWDFGDFTNSSATAPLHAYAANGSYTVVLTAINGTCTDDYTMTVSISVSLEELSGLSEVILYPNPTNAETTISFNSQTAQEANVKMINALGQIVSDNMFNTEAGFNQIELGTAELNNGLYNVMIETENGLVIRKLIIQK
jgi:PKD repeat protein